MAKVVIEYKENAVDINSINPGDYFKDTENDELYILCNVEGNYVSISLHDGMSWNNLRKDKSEAIVNLVPVSNVNITFS